MADETQVKQLVIRIKADLDALETLCTGEEPEVETADFPLAGHAAFNPGADLGVIRIRTEVAEASSVIWDPDGDRLQVASDQGFIKSFTREGLQDRGSHWIGGDLEAIAMQWRKKDGKWTSGDKAVLREREKDIVTFGGDKLFDLHPNIPINGGLGAEGLEYVFGKFLVVSQSSNSVWDSHGGQWSADSAEAKSGSGGFDEIRRYGHTEVILSCVDRKIYFPEHTIDLHVDNIEGFCLLPNNEIALAIDNGNEPGWVEVWSVEG